MEPRRSVARRSFALVPISIGLLAVLAGCGTSPTTSTSTPNPTSYHYETAGAVMTFDPVLAYDAASSAVLENIYQTLYGYTETGGTTPQPELATSVSVSTDGLTYTFELRHGVVFHSGNPFTCADIEYSIERALVTNPPSSGVWSLALPLTGTSRNANADPSVTWSLIDGSITCPGPYQAVFHLAQKSAAFLAILGQTTYGIVDSAWAKSHGEWDGTQASWKSWVGADLRSGYLNDHASGTGAYQLTSASSTSVTANAFKDFWGAAPSVDTIHVETVTDPTQRVTDLLDGSADRIDLEPGNLGLVTGKSGVTVHSDPSWSRLAVSGILFNEAIDASGNPYVGSGTLDGNGIPANFFADLDTRLCFAYSFDPQSYINAALNGQGVPLTMALPPSLLGYNDTITPYSLDTAIATSHCQAAQGGALWATGFTLTAAYNSGNATRQAALEDLKANLEALNPKFHLSLVSLSWPTYLDDIAAKTLPVFDMGWGADYADPDDFIRTFYDSTGYYGASIGFHDSTVDSEIEQAAVAQDPTARAGLYQRIGQQAHDLAPLIPLPQPAPVIVTRTSVQGVYYNPALNGQFLWKDVSN